MLVLSRNPEEDVIFIHRQTGERITVKVVRVRGDRVGLGITASQDWQVIRNELEERDQLNVKESEQGQGLSKQSAYDKDKRGSLLGYRFPITTTTGDSLSES